MRLFLCFLSLWLVCVQTSLGQNKTTTTAKTNALKAKAKEDFRLGHYEAAISSWKELYHYTKNPKILINIGNSYQKLKRYEEALSSYKGFLVEVMGDDSELVFIVTDMVDELEVLLKQGSIEITTNQDPVDVYINAVFKGTTPLEVKELSPGEHTVVLQKKGFTEYQQKVTLAVQQKQKLSVSMNPLPGAIHISSEQDPADVYIDGVLVGQSPIISSSIAPGSHLIAFDKKGFTRYQAQIQVAPAQDVVLRPVLAIAKGELLVYTNLKNAEVRLNSQQMGETDAKGRLSMSVPLGQYELGVSSRWFLPHKQQILLVEDIPQQLKVSCKAQPKSLALYAAPPSLLLASGLLLRSARIRQAELDAAQNVLLIITPDDAARLHKEWTRGIALVVTADVSAALALVSGSVAAWGSINRIRQRTEWSPQ